MFGEPSRRGSIGGDDDSVLVAVDGCLSAFSGISAHFRPRRHRLSATQWRTEIAERFAVWREVSALEAAA